MVCLEGISEKCVPLARFVFYDYIYDPNYILVSGLYLPISLRVISR
jgi:hypothetical protein